MNEYYKTKRMRVSEWYRTWLKFVCRIIYSSPYYSLFTDLGWDVCQFNYHLLLANFEFNFRKWNLLLASKLAKVPVERLQAAAGWRWLPGLFIETQFLYIYWNIAREELYSQCKVCSSNRQWAADHQDLSVNQWKATCHLKVVFLRDYSHFYLILTMVQKSVDVDCPGYWLGVKSTNQSCD